MSEDRDKPDNKESLGHSRGAARKSFLLRISPDLLSELKGWSAHEFRSLNSQIEYILQDAVRKRRGKKGQE